MKIRGIDPAVGAAGGPAAARPAAGRRERPRPGERRPDEPPSAASRLSGAGPGHLRASYQPHRWREECGIFGLYAPGEPLADLCYLGLFALQHRGQESAGISVTDGFHIDTVKGMGLLTEVFRSGRPALGGHAAIGHVRYSTTGASTHANIQPIFAHHRGGFVGLGHNGNLTNADALKAAMIGEGYLFQTTTDSEVMLNLIAGSVEPDMEKRIGDNLRKCAGAYSLVILTADRLIGVRDPRGYRPLSLGRLPGGGLALASETCALDAVKAVPIRDVRPGEIVSIGADGIRSSIFEKADRVSGCVFEHIYFARPDSVLDGLSVWDSRFRMGRQLAREFGGQADIVIPVPDTGITAALGFSEESSLPYKEGLIKNRYVGRSFIMPQQSGREATVEMKLNPVRFNLEGRRVVLIDDSIVRGTTSARIVSLVRRAGAKEVHMCISSPPITQTCHYGIDTSIRKELIAATKTVEEIRRSLGVDSLNYLSQEGLLASVDDAGNQRHCLECFS